MANACTNTHVCHRPAGISRLFTLCAHGRFETGVSRTPSRDPTYVVRVTGNDPGMSGFRLSP